MQWWPWGPDALAEAQRTGKPIFLSIGYAACHWCHVMAHESFEDEDTAALMNERYINIKVDREERPDVDALYMNAIQVQGEGGGWPLSAWCMPDGKPFFLGTYFPPQDKYGKPSFRQVLRVMSDAFQGQRDQVIENTEALLDGLSRMDAHFRAGAAAGEVAALTPGLLINAGRTIVGRCDAKRGGLSGAPKFPNSAIHDLLGRTARLAFGDPSKVAYLAWARGMVDGGIYDHLGGGFARYAVDDKWLVPHFEKMLYDNAQLLTICADAFAMSGESRYRYVIVETVGWLSREMSDAAGGLYSSLDADSEGEEGKFYVWTPAQVREVLGAVDSMQFDSAYGVTDGGNFEHGATVLSRVSKRGAESDEVVLGELRARLFEARSKRVRPATDDKVLAGWNGLAISGLCHAARATGDIDARALAVRVGNFLVDKMLKGDRLGRVYKGGAVKLDGTLEDYAFVAAAFLDLAELTGDKAWWQRGEALVATIRARFVATDAQGVIVFYLNTDDDEAARLVHRPESHHDGAIPSGAAVAVESLLRLGLISGDTASQSLAERYLAQRIGRTGDVNPLATPRLFAALDAYLHTQVVVITEGGGRDSLVAAVGRAYCPSTFVAGPWASASWRDGKAPRADGRSQAYVCRGQSCSPPVANAAELLAVLTAPLG